MSPSDSFSEPLASVPDDALESSITTLAAHIHAATYRLLALLAEFDRRRAWAGPGLRSCAHWLNWKCGIAPGAAREKVRVAHALAELPGISHAFEHGELSYSKVRAMTRVATPANERALLNIALHGTAEHVERVVRGYRRVGRVAEATATERVHQDRALRWYWDGDGAPVLHARLAPDVGARLLAAVEVLVEATEKQRDTSENVPAGTRAAPSDTKEDDPLERRLAALRQRNAERPARRADALVSLVERGLTVPDPEIRSNPCEIVVHVDAKTLKGADTDRERCELEHGPGLAAETARRLACDGAIVHLTEGADGEPLTIGRRTRAVPAPMRRALHARDRGCRFPGCTATHRVEAHHIHHWAGGGETSTANLAELCPAHHRLVHEGGYGLERRTDGRLHFMQPDGTTIPDCPRQAAVEPRSVLAQLGEAERNHGITIGARTCVPVWDGYALDTVWAVEGVLAADGKLEC